MTLFIRDSEEADLPAIADIYAHAVLHGTASFELEPPDAAELAARRAALLEKGFPFIVAVTEDVVCGYAYYGPYRPRPAYRFTVEDSIYVAPDFQGKSVGRALLTSLLLRAEASGFRQMVAVIGDSGSSGSIGLHRSLGFVDAGIVRAVGFKHGAWRDQVLMQRALGEGSATSPA